MGAINDARDRLCAELAAAGLVVINDSRNVRPLGVIVSPPTINTPTLNSVSPQMMVEFQVTAVAPPPGNLDAEVYLCNIIDTIIKTVDVVNATPGTYDGNDGQTLPAYICNVNYLAY
jgi:hypothetical protein